MSIRRLAISVAVAGALLAAPVMTAAGRASASPSAPSTSTIPFHTRVGHILGMIPPVRLGSKTTGSSKRAAITNSAPASGSLDYNGGPVMVTNKVYTIFWAPSGYAFPAGYQNDINGYFQNLQATRGSNSNTYDVATQYYQEVNGAKQYVQNNTTFAGTTLDADALPALDPVNCPDTPVAATNGVASATTSPASSSASCVTDAQVQQEISAVAKKQGWPVSNNTEFFMFTAPNIGTCFPAQETVSESGVQTTVTVPLCSFSYFCAYHSSYYDSTINPNSQVIYANMPYAAQTAGNPLTCDEQSYPNGNPADPEINVTSHEHNESISDPFGTAWWDSNPSDSAYGDEIGDMCAWDFGNLYGVAGAQYSRTIKGHHYLMQTEWDNSTAGCPGSNSTGGAVPSHPNYATPEISMTPDIGYQTAPFKIVGMFFGAGETVADSFANPGQTSSTSLGSSVANASGQTYLFTSVPQSALAGTDTVTSRGTTGTASAPFTVPTR